MAAGGWHVVAALGVLLVLAAGCSGGRGYRIVQPAVAFEMLRDSPNLAIVDLRPASRYSGGGGRIPGSLNLPLAELVARLEELAALKEVAFLVYCDDPACIEAGIDLLREAGFRYPFVIEGGFEAWTAKGLPAAGRSELAPGRQDEGSGEEIPEAQYLALPIEVGERDR